LTLHGSWTLETTPDIQVTTACTVLDKESDGDSFSKESPHLSIDFEVKKKS